MSNGREVARDRLQSDLELRLLAKMRDRLTHQYWAIDRAVVWSTAHSDIPQLRSALAAALSRLGGI